MSIQSINARNQFRGKIKEIIYGFVHGRGFLILVDLTKKSVITITVNANFH